MSISGPSALFLSWCLHDLEEAVAFPATSRRLADVTGIDSLRMSGAEGAAAIGLMGVLVGAACLRGTATKGRSRLYRYAVGGLEAHVWSHLGSSLALRGYTAGVATALPVMLPGPLHARRSLERDGLPLSRGERMTGAAVMLGAAIAAQGAARLLRLRRRA